MDKERCRKKCLKSFKTAALRGKFKRDRMIEKKLSYLLKKLGSKNILIYLPLDFESDLRPLIKRTRKRYNFYLPFMQDVSFKMVPFRLPIKKYRFNIKQSGNSIFKIFKIDTVVVPTVGIDDSFRRVGFGKGMYDRFFDSLDYRPKIIFIQPGLCRCPGIVTSEHDIDGDFLITPEALFFKRKKGSKNVDRDALRGRDYSRSHLFYHKKNRPCQA